MKETPQHRASNTSAVLVEFWHSINLLARIKSSSFNLSIKQQRLGECARRKVLGNKLIIYVCFTLTWSFGCTVVTAVINSSTTFALDFVARASISLSFASTSFCAACSAWVFDPVCYIVSTHSRERDYFGFELFEVLFFLSFVRFYLLCSFWSGIFDFLCAV